MQLMTLQEVASRLGISHRTAQRRLAEGRFPLPPVQWHKWPRFLPADLEALEAGPWKLPRTSAPRGQRPSTPSGGVPETPPEGIPLV